MDKLTYGWLSPDGEFVQCDFYDHLDKAREIYAQILGINKKDLSYKAYCRADDNLIQMGWTKIGRSEFSYEWNIVCRKLTKEQYDILKPLVESVRLGALSKYRFEEYEDRI